MSPFRYAESGGRKTPHEDKKSQRHRPPSMPREKDEISELLVPFLAKNETNIASLENIPMSIVFLLLLVGLHTPIALSTTINVPVRVDIQDGDVVRTFVANPGDNTLETIETFCASHDFGHAACANIVNALCAREDIPCGRELMRQEITDENGQSLPPFVIREGQSASRAALTFCANLGWSSQQCDMLLNRVCNTVACDFVVNQEMFGSRLVILDGQDVVSTFAHFWTSSPNPPSRKMAKNVLVQLCEQEHAECEVLFTTDVHVHLKGPNAPSTSIGVVSVYRGEAPLDAVQAFCLSNDMSPEVCAYVKHQVCRDAQKENVQCDESRPLVSLPIADEQNVGRGTLHVYIGQEPVDVINAFVRRTNLPKNYVSFLTRMLCDDASSTHGRDLVCSRRQPALEFEFITVPAHSLEDIEREANSPDGQWFAGTLTIFDVEDEVADAVYDFWIAQKLPLTYRWPVLRKLCTSLRDIIVDVVVIIIALIIVVVVDRPCTGNNDIASCTRAEGRLSSLPVKNEGKDKGELELFENQEPADAVLKFAEDKGMMAKRDMLMDALCQTKRGAPLCSRGRALSHARRELFDMKLTFMGLSHTIRYISSNGMADNWDCNEIANGMGEECEHMSVIVARQFCSLFADGLGPGNCENDILKFISEQIDSWENRRWAGKEYYEYLDVPIDADLGTIEMSYRRQLRELGSSADHNVRRQKLQEAYDVLSDAKKKAYYDQPCKEFPGLTGMCVKHLPDGGMNILCGGSKI